MARDGADREQQIVEQALRLFSQTGYHATSLQDIADELGITRPAFYYYFRSKDELLWTLIRNLGDQLLAEARPIARQPVGAPEKLRRLVVAHVRTILGNADAFKIYFTERHMVGQRRDRQLRRGEDQYIRLFEDTIAEGQEAGAFRAENPHVLALIVLGVANSVLRWFQPRRDLSEAEVSKLIGELAVASLARPRGSPSSRSPRPSAASATRRA